MKRFTLTHYFVFLMLIFPVGVMSQVTMDLEILGGLTMNSKDNNYSDESYSFELRNGLSYGLGFDVWFPKDYGLTFGFRFSKSFARNTINYPDGFSTASTSFNGGELRDRVFYLGAKKRLFLDKKESLSVTPHLGFSYNPFFFDNDDVEYSHVLHFENNTLSEDRFVYNRFNTQGEDYLGSFGARAGIGIEKVLTRVGTFSLSMVYTFDLRKSVDRNLSAFQSSTLWENSTGNVEQSFFYSRQDSQNIRRNFLMIELGFKMPASILLSRGKE